MIVSMPDNSSRLADDRSVSEGARRSARILQFPQQDRLAEQRPSGSARLPEDDDSGLFDLAQYERDRDDGEDLSYGHRMLMNVMAVAIITLLVGVGVWIADTMGALQRDQDCLLQGRKNCAPIEIAAPKK
jgi:hypothetical protein